MACADATPAPAADAEAFAEAVRTCSHCAMMPTGRHCLSHTCIDCGDAHPVSVDCGH
jgi:hypothetical protein